MYFSYCTVQYVAVHEWQVREFLQAYELPPVPVAPVRVPSLSQATQTLVELSIAVQKPVVDWALVSRYVQVRSSALVVALRLDWELHVCVLVCTVCMCVCGSGAQKHGEEIWTYVRAMRQAWAARHVQTQMSGEKPAEPQIRGWLGTDTHSVFTRNSLVPSLIAYSS